MKQNASLSIRKPENTSQASAAAFNAIVIGAFFHNLHGLCSKFHFPPGRIWNCNKTGVPTVVQAPKVIVKRGAKQVTQTMSAERGENPTMLCLVSATGQTIPPVFVFSKSQGSRENVSRWTTKMHWLSSGWLTSENFLSSMQHFQKEVKPSKEGPV